MIVNVTHIAPEKSRLLVFIVLYMIYIIGYTFQCVVTKLAQTCLTNDPKQRPMFTIFDGIYNTILFAAIPVLVFQNLMPKLGFKDALQTVDTPMSTVIKAVAMFCMYGLLIIGLVCNLIAMKFYPLTKEKMEGIQAEIAEIKKKLQNEAL